MTRKAKAPLTPERIMQYAWGYATTFVVEAAVEHHVFDRLDESPRTVQELAVVTGTSPRGLSALLNALVGLQLVTRINDRYGLTPESAAFLVSTKPSFHGGVFRNFRTHLLPNWQQLPDVVRTGKPAKAVNQENAGPEFFAELVEAIFPLSYPAARRFGEHLGLAKAITPVSVLDIGAGAGVWGVALAQQSPQVLVRAVDWPRVLEITRKVAQRHGVADRLTTAPGDLLEADFGSGHDGGYHRPHPAQRRRGAQPAIAAQDIRGARSGWHGCHHGIPLRRRSRRSAARADVRREHARPYRSRRHVYVCGNQPVVARGGLRQSAFARCAGSIPSHPGDEAQARR